MTQENICRVLIVDNKLDFAAQTASKLEEIRPCLLNHNRLEIELTNNAYFAAKKLGQCSLEEPPWHVVISDVYMPFPRNPSLPKLVADSVELIQYKSDEGSWPCWHFPYPPGELEEKIEHGGSCIAEVITARLSAGEQLSDLKMVMMSDCLSGEDRAQILAYEESKRDWLKYYDKTDWRREKLTRWPQHQLEPDVFQWALILGIAQREWKYWGDSIYKKLPPADAIVFGAVTTAYMVGTVTEARRIGSDNEIQTVLITGERGTGREVFAQLIHQVRMESLGLEGQFVGIDCSSIPEPEFEAQLLDRAEEAESGTLFIDEVDTLRPYLQGTLYHLLKDKKIIGGDRIQSLDFSARLTICTASARNLEELNRNALFHDDLYFLLKDEQLYVQPLRNRPADAVSLAEILAKRDRNELTLSSDARDWIETYPWPGNTRQLMNVIRVAVRKELRSHLTAENLRRILDISPVIPTHQVFHNEKRTVEFQAEPPFQLHSGTNVLIDGQKQQISIRWDLYDVLKALLHKDKEKEGPLTFAEIAAVYRRITDPERAPAIAHEFARRLRRAMDAFGMGHKWLVTTDSGVGYRKGTQWNPKSALVYTSEPRSAQKSPEQAERDKFRKATGVGKKRKPDY